jgi:hypothetical protein
MQTVMAQMDSGSLADAAGGFWALKPWWCQPWSILLTGTAAISGSWLLFQRWWISVPLALGVAVWWLMFLVLVPAAYRQASGSGEAVAEPD